MVRFDLCRHSLGVYLNGGVSVQGSTSFPKLIVRAPTTDGTIGEPNITLDGNTGQITAASTVTCVGIPCAGVTGTGTSTATASGTGTYRPLAVTGMTIDGSGFVPKSQPVAAVGKFYFVTGTGTATATTTAVTSLGNITGMGCLP